MAQSDKWNPPHRALQSGHSDGHWTSSSATQLSKP
jgi:hypothetical protein